MTATAAPSAAGVETAAAAVLAPAMRGDLLHPGSPGYDDARAVYNAMIDKRPALIARCVDAADVAAAVRFGRDEGLDVAVRGGGHNGAGLATCDDGLVIDLSLMHGCRIDPVARTATVQGGALLGDVDHAAHGFGLGVPAGIISSTGIGGLTLGGGFGHLSRQHGLTIDHLRSVDVVLADGRLVVADADHHPDLFWAVRGGGGNFGVVTSFTFDLVPVGTLFVGPMLWPMDRAKEILSWYRDFLPAQPRELNGFFAFLTVPPVPMFPEALHLQKMCGVVWCLTDPSRQEELLAPARALQPALDGTHPAPYPALQAVFDGLYPPGDQWYWRADFIDEINDDAVAAHVEHAAQLPTPQSTMHLYPIDGAVHDVPADATAFSFRSSRWAQVIVGVDPDPANAATVRDWCIGYHEAVHPHTAGGAYVNMLMDEGHERVQATYRGNYARLAKVKAAYDPANVFHVNQNIPPGSPPGA